MAKPATNIHIPLRTDEAISLIARVKPTAQMPRPGSAGDQGEAETKAARKASR